MIPERWPGAGEPAAGPRNRTSLAGEGVAADAVGAAVRRESCREHARFPGDREQKSRRVLRGGTEVAP